MVIERKILVMELRAVMNASGFVAATLNFYYYLPCTHVGTKELRSHALKRDNTDY